MQENKSGIILKQKTAKLFLDIFFIIILLFIKVSFHIFYKSICFILKALTCLKYVNLGLWFLQSEFQKLTEKNLKGKIKSWITLFYESNLF